MGLRCLFPPALGFECIEAGMCNPIIGRFSAHADPHLRFTPVRGLYCHSEFAGRKVRDVPGFDWILVALGAASPATIGIPRAHRRHALPPFGRSRAGIHVRATRTRPRRQAPRLARSEHLTRDKRGEEQVARPPAA